MSTITEQNRETVQPEKAFIDRPAKVVTGGAMGEGLCGAAAAVLAILGLAGLLPQPLLSVAVVLVGGALMWEGSLVASQYNRLVRESPFLSRVEFGSETGIQVAGGAAGVVLGVLALLDVHAPILSGAAAILYGVVLIAASYPVEVTLQRRDGRSVPFSPQNAGSAAGLQVIAGSASGILGILALVGTVGTPVMTLELVAMLCAGAAMAFGGAAATCRVYKTFTGTQP